MFKLKRENIYCRTCTFFKSFDSVDNKPNEEGKRFCEVCTEWQVKVTPEGRDRTCLNSGCHLKINEKNDCPFFSRIKVDNKTFEKLRITCKLKMAK